MRFTTSYSSRKPGPAVEPAEAPAPDIHALREVAAEHAPDGGYGETYYNEAERTVWWNAADWTSLEELEAARDALLAVPGVADVEVHDEAHVPEGDAWQRVWPPGQTDRGGGSEIDEEALLAEVVSMAAEPLQIDEEPSHEPTEGLLADAEKPIFATGGQLPPEVVQATLDAIVNTHRHATDKLGDVLVAAGEQHSNGRSDWLTAAALDAISKLAQRPEAPAPNVHVHVPKNDLSVTVEQPEFKPQITVEGAKIEVPERPVQVDVHVPEQPAPEVHVAAATPEIVVQPGTAPVVNVNMPDAIRTIPAETETVAERDADDLIVRSVTRPTGE